MPRLLNVHRVNYRKGGAEAVFLEHSALFRENGWECAEFAMAHPLNLPSEWSEYFAEPYLADEMDFPERVVTSPRFLWSSDAAGKFQRIICDFKPDIIHIHGLYHQLTTSVLVEARRSGIPVVFTAHDFKALCPAHYFYNRRFGVCEQCKGGRQWKAFANKCLHDSWASSLLYSLEGSINWWSGRYQTLIDAMVMPSRFMLGKYEEHAFPREKLHHVPNFYEPETSSVGGTSARETQDGGYTLYFGRLSQEKGIDVLLKAAAAAGVRALIAGDGPERSALETLASKLSAHAQFLGHKAGSELWELVSRASSVVLPSVWYENAPKSVLEAQGQGRIVIASDIGGIPELVTHGETGFLFEPGDVAGLEQLLTEVHTMSASEKERIGGSARRASTQGFSKDKYLERMYRVYGQAAKARGKELIWQAMQSRTQN